MATPGPAEQADFRPRCEGAIGPAALGKKWARRYSFVAPMPRHNRSLRAAAALLMLLVPADLLATGARLGINQSWAWGPANAITGSATFFYVASGNVLLTYSAGDLPSPAPKHP